MLEAGPGATPHPGSQVLLEKRFPDYEAFRQRGGLRSTVLDKPIVYYDGGAFPFRDGEFDYVICSHVLEHVDNPQEFLQELVRVASRGYLEFPTVLYEYLYNFDEHLNLLGHRDRELLWMPKSETGLRKFQAIHQFLRKTLESGYDEMIKAMKEQFFIGFEWNGAIILRRVSEIEELIPDWNEIPVRVGAPERRSVLDRARNFWARLRG